MAPREGAARDVRTVEDCVLQLIERDAAGSESTPLLDAPGPQFGPATVVSDAQFERLLDALASWPGLPHLPRDFSRADIDADHD